MALDTKPRDRLGSEHAYDTIKVAIRRCSLRPGQLVTEPQLEADLGLRRAAVRSALVRLHQENLVTAIPRKGYLIASASIQDLNELVAVRKIIEPATVEMAAEYPDRIARLPKWSELVGGIRYSPSDADSMAAFLAANTTFHSNIASVTGNVRLTRILRDVLESMERLHHLGFEVQDRNEEMYTEHDEIVEALVVGDGSRAAEVSRRAIEDAYRMVFDALSRSSALRSVNLGRFAESD